MIFEPMESDFEIPALDQALLDGKPGLDAETRAVMRALVSEKCVVRIFDCCGDEDE